MDCNQVRKQLKSFLGDLLLDEDHRFFLEHLDYCVSCKAYVRSIGDISNQIWKLGNISVPADFKSTVLFKLSHPETLAITIPAATSRGFQKKYGAVFLIAILGLAIFALGIMLLKTQKPKRSSDVILDQMQTQVDSLAAEDSVVAQTSMRLEGAAKKSSRVLDLTVPIPSELQDAPASSQELSEASQPIHWHLTYFKDQNTGTEKSLQLKAVLYEAEQLKDTIQGLESTVPKLGQSYSEEEKQIQIAAKAQRDTSLSELIPKMRLLDAKIKKMEEDRRSAERDKQLIKKKILDKFVAGGVKIKYQTEDFIIFSVTSDQLERIREDARYLFKDTGSFQDLDGAGSSEQDQSVSVYFDQSEISNRHWHVDSVADKTKAQLFDAVREAGGSIDYESEATVVFLVPQTMVDYLKNKIQALRIELSQFGNDGSTVSKLSNAPVKIAVHFSKRG